MEEMNEIKLADNPKVMTIDCYKCNKILTLRINYESEGPKYYACHQCVPERPLKPGYTVHYSTDLNLTQ